MVGVGVVDGLEVPKRVGTAPDVDGVDEVGVAAVAVADQDPGEAVEDLPGVDVGDAASPNVHCGELVVAGHVQVCELPGGPRGGLVHVQEPGPVQDLLDVAHERFQRGGGAAANVDEPAGRAVDARQVTQQLFGATEGQVMGHHGEHCPGLHSRTPLHPPACARGCRPDGDRAAARAGLGDHPVLGDQGRRGRGHLEHLPLGYTKHCGIGQVGPTVAALRWRAVDHLVRIGDLVAGGPGIAVLLARLAPGLPSHRRRLRWRLAIRAVRGGRLRGVRGVPVQPVLEFGDASSQLLDPAKGRDQPSDQLVAIHRLQPHIHNMLNDPEPRPLPSHEPEPGQDEPARHPM